VDRGADRFVSFVRSARTGARQQVDRGEYLEQFKVPVLSDIDTRLSLVRHVRDHGVMRGVISNPRE